MSDQAATQSPSIEARIASQFDPASDQPPEQQPQQAEGEQPEGTGEPEFEEVEYEGERFQVPPKLKKGLMLNEDYTRKTQELSDSRTKLEIAQKQIKLTEQQGKFRESIAEDVQMLASIDAYLKQPVDWNNLSVEEMLRKRGEFDQLRERKNELQTSLTQREQEFMQKVQGEHGNLVKEVNAYLAKNIQGWSPEVAKEVSEWAKAQGFTQEELNSIINPVHAMTLYKARQYDKLVANKDLAVSAAAKAAPMGKPGSSNPMPQQVRDKLNYRKAVAKLPVEAPERRRIVEDRVAQIFNRK
jgi:hypothetical protein